MINYEKIKLLIVSANPATTSFLNLEREKREIEEAIRYSPYRDLFVIEMLHAARISDLRRAFADEQRTPNILHFCGHGGGERGLVFESQDGVCKLVSGDALAEFLSLFTESLDCVVLNACYSEVQAKEIQKYVNCVIGMEETVDDESAIVFASAFYEALAAGRTYQLAYDYANKALALEGDLSEMHSVLLLRDNISPFGVHDSKIQVQPLSSGLMSHLSKHNYSVQFNDFFGISPDAFPFYGHKRELERFLEMCYESSKAAPTVEIIVVTGESGIGKSRFVYEVSKKLPKEQWDSFWLPVSFFIDGDEAWRTIKDWNYSKNILFVVDNISLVAESASRWIQHLMRDKTVGRKMVVALIDRCSPEQNDNSKFISMLIGEPEWMRVMRHNNFDFVGLSYEDKTIYLGKPDRSDLSDICLEFAKYHSCQISQLEICEIIEKLEYLDKHMRPLFLFFILDAWHKKERWNQWDLESLLRYIRDSESRRLRVRFADSAYMYDKACNLMLLANIFDQIDVTDVRLKETHYFIKYCSCAESREYETIIGQLKLLGYYKNGILCSNKAFLVSEFSVLCECMQRSVNDNDFIPALMSSLWQYASLRTSVFLTSVIGDYYGDNKTTDFKDLFERERGLLYKPVISKEMLSLYLIPYSLFIGRNKSLPLNHALNKIKEMILHECNDEVANILWAGIVLTIVTRRRDEQTRLFALEELRMLVKKRPDKYIVGNLIELLLQLTISADVKQTKAYIKEIKELILNDGQEDFIIKYVGALQNLIVKLPVADAQIYIDEIYDLYEKNPNEGIKSKYFQALHNYYILEMITNYGSGGSCLAERTFDKMKSLIDSGTSNDIKILCYHCAYIKFIFHNPCEQSMDEQEIEWAKNIFILLINNDTLSPYLNCCIGSFGNQGIFDVKETDENSDSEVLLFFSAVVRDFINSQSEYTNTVYEVLKFIVDVTKDMAYYSYPFFLSLIDLMIKINEASLPVDSGFIISKMKSLLMGLAEHYDYHEIIVVFCVALMQTWDHYTAAEQDEIALLFYKTYRNNPNNDEIAKIYSHILRLGCESSDLDLKKKSYNNFKILVRENVQNEIIICQFFAACEAVISAEKNERLQKEVVSDMCGLVCDEGMKSKKGLETFVIVVFRLNICISRWLPELSKKLKQIGSSDLTVTLIIVQAFYALCKCPTLEWERDITDGLPVWAENDTIKYLVDEIVSIMSGKKEGDLENAFLQLIDIMSEVIKSYSYVDLTYKFKLILPVNTPDYDRSIKNVKYLQNTLNIQKE